MWIYNKIISLFSFKSQDSSKGKRRAERKCFSAYVKKNLLLFKRSTFRAVRFINDVSEFDRRASGIEGDTLSILKVSGTASINQFL